MTRASNGFWSDFQKFLMRGNVIDLAVAVVIGGAFGKIVTSLVEDIITPAILSPVLQRLHLNDLQQLSVNGIKYGVFLAAVLNFLVITLSIFAVIRAFEKSRRKVWRQEAADAEVAPPDPNVILQEKTANALDRLSQALETRSL